MRRSTLALGLLIAAAAAAVRGDVERAASTPPVAVFSALDGTWRGAFVGYDVRGVELYRIDVRQTYRTIDHERQAVEVVDRQADGTVTRGRGFNVAKRRDDGTLELTCSVTKDDGDAVRHEGRVVRGPDGDEEIVWSTDSLERSETFRESVRREGDAWIYAIDGMGRYGDTRILMCGRYRKE